MKIDNYNEAKNFLESRNQYGIKPGLERMEQMILASSYDSKCKIIHVTGTNGKGSTTAYIEAGLLTSKNNIGTFTSPSLTGLTGHFKLNNQEMLEEEFVFYLNKLLPIIKKIDSVNNHPSEFEIITMIAILYFEERADIAIIETGMGGLLDTTNVIKPIISVITSISIDHEAFLGKTLREITKHKAGIIKEGIPVVLGKVEDESLQIVRQTAKNCHSELFQFGKEFILKKLNDTYQFIQIKEAITQSFKLKNKGVYQSLNASLALQVFLFLKDYGISLKLETCTQAIEDLIISNRFEIINECPRVIIDGAHNLASMHAFLETVKLDKRLEKQLIISAFKDKPLKEMIELAKNEFENITVTTFNHKRAYSVKELNALDISHELEPNWFKLIDQIKEEANNKLTYYVVGSVYFTSIFKQAIIDKQ